MADIPRIAASRKRARLDIRVPFRISTGGMRVGGIYQPAFVDFTVWARREDADTRAAYDLGLAGFREVGEVRLIVRWDDRMKAGTSNTFTLGNDSYIINLVEEIGRRRYMAVSGSLQDSGAS